MDERMITLLVLPRERDARMRALERKLRRQERRTAVLCLWGAALGLMMAGLQSQIKEDKAKKQK
ncbi:MAG: hypothetical protein SOW46_11060 [Candidatus Aphodomonas sp.]|nr:hypothetical protein [Candidatus Aphodomonas sp.]